MDSWEAKGIVLSMPDKEATVEDLLKFAQWVARDFPNATVRLAEFGLRVTEYERNDVGPYIDWRD